jgi:hypothetical protein
MAGFSARIDRGARLSHREVAGLVAAWGGRPGVPFGER